MLLDYTNIRAPFDAVVLTKNADIGDIVTPLAATADAKAAVVSSSRHGLAAGGGRRIRVQHRAGQVGQPCEIRLDAFADTRFPARVHMILPTADRSKASITVKVAFREHDPRVLPEMSAKVAFLSREPAADEQAPSGRYPLRRWTGATACRGVFLIRGTGARGRRGDRPPVREMVELRDGPPVASRIATAPRTN